MKLLQLGLSGNFQEIEVSTGGSANFVEETKIISNADVQNGYIYTSSAALLDSLSVVIDGITLVESFDYCLQYLTDRTKIIWVAAFASGGVQEVTSGEKFILRYATADSAIDFAKESITLTAGDVAAQFVDLPVYAKPNSVSAIFENTELMSGIDYSVTDAGDHSRISFLGEFASGGLSALEPGDTIQIQFCIVQN